MGNLSDIQIAFMCGFGAIALLMFIMTLIFKLSVRSKKDNCISTVQGKVVGYTATAQSSYCVHLPVVEYEVNGEKYTKVGPKYIFVETVVKSSFVKETTVEHSTDIYAEVFKLKVRRNMFMSVVKNPMVELFPIDSCIDVHYDPRKPKRAYVLRPLEHKTTTLIFTIIGIVSAMIVCAAALL